METQAFSSQNNYRVNYSAPISSDQADLRLDYTINAKQSMFIRGNYKIRSVFTHRIQTAPATALMRVHRSPVHLAILKLTRV